MAEALHFREPAEQLYCLEYGYHSAAVFPKLHEERYRSLPIEEDLVGSYQRCGQWGAQSLSAVDHGVGLVDGSLEACHEVSRAFSGLCYLSARHILVSFLESERRDGSAKDDKPVEHFLVLQGETATGQETLVLLLLL